MALYKGTTKYYIKGINKSLEDTTPIYSGPSTLSPGSTIASGQKVATDLMVQGDSDLVAANISSQVQIFGTKGTF